MRCRARITAALLAAAPTGALACGFGEPVETGELSAEVWAAVSEAASVPAADILDAPGQVSVSALDLNDDGSPELCLALETTQTCAAGNAVCLHVILTEGTPPRTIYKAASHGVRLGEDNHHGWRDLQSITNTAEGEITSPVAHNGDVYEIGDQ